MCRELLEILAIAIFVAAFVVQPFRIPSASMEPTMRVGDFLLADKQSFAPAGRMDGLLPPARVERGDLVIFHYPADPKMDLVKRVIGLPGDRLRLRNGTVYVNEKPLAEPYAVYSPASPDSFRDDFPSLRSTDPNADPRWWAEIRRTEKNGEITVPAGDYFVMGDNRNNSEDSRYWGYVPQEAIVGRPLLVYFSVAAPARLPEGSFWVRLKATLRAEFGNLRVLR